MNASNPNLAGSAQFIVEYAGAPVKFAGIGFDLVPAEQASVFSNEADAWQAAHQHHLSPKNTRVVTLYSRQINL